METETMIRELRNLQEKHKNDQVFTFGTRWTDVCRDVANRLEELVAENAELKKAPELVWRLTSASAQGKLITKDNEYDVYINGIDLYKTYEHGVIRAIHKFSLTEI